MGWNDRIEDSELGNLPPEAFGNVFDVEGPFDPENTWLESADEEDQRIAVKEWFLARYCDPALETPYNGKEGGYLFINGGPFDPADEIPERFSGIVSDEIIDDVIGELHGDVGEMWAPIDFAPDYDEYLSYEPHSRDEPGIAFNKRLGEIERVLLLTTQTDPQTAKLLEQLAFGSVISAIEAFLAEITTYWAVEDDAVLQRVAAKELKDRKFTLTEIFDDADTFKSTVLTHLASNVVWHRLDKLKPTIEHGLRVSLPDIGGLMSAVNIRHDIVHRAGRTKEGQQITINADQVKELCWKAREFVTAMEAEINRSFPREADTEDF
ncbi:hypothetical protein DFR40_0948 [Azonexus fungiphilus]|uniref:RiboL-PSP-HEPN domain-containing protein n=1 Tax=Azonexus fungiphilus TaxID=146940 RepID=A0A495WGH5_9RHOO|nr:hypothetical protein [Azonexus fungiphilus]RKT60801.1 hypothetical protein DFR40_0948 [Azonexus fungiphilus]